MNPIPSSGKIGKTGSDFSSESKKGPSNYNQKKSQDNIKVKKVQNLKFYANDYIKKLSRKKLLLATFSVIYGQKNP